MHGRRSLGRGVHPPLEGTSRVREFEAIPRETMSTEGQQPMREDEGPLREEMTEETQTNRGQRMTMGEYALPDIGNQPSPIVLDPIARGYELRTMHVNLLPSFHGKLNEDCLQFMKEYSAIIETFPIMRLTREQLQMRCFQYCMKDAAMTWLMGLRPGSLTSWSQICKVFFNRFFPARKAKELKVKIADFYESEGELFHESWERYQRLVAQCPPHMFTEEYKVSCFQAGLTRFSQVLVDNACGGSYDTKTASEIYDIYEMLAQNSQQRNANSIRGGKFDVNASTETAIEISKINKRVETLTSHIESLGFQKAGVKLLGRQEGSSSGQFNENEGFEDTFQGQEQEEVQAMGFQGQGNNSYSNNYVHPWRNHPNLSWSNNNNILNPPPRNQQQGNQQQGVYNQGGSSQGGYRQGQQQGMNNQGSSSQGGYRQNQSQGGYPQGGYPQGGFPQGGNQWGGNQWNNNNNAQPSSYQPRRNIDEEMRGMMQGFQRAENTLTSFMQASGQRFGNLEASFGKLETQMGQIAEALQKQEKGKFPSHTEQAKEGNFVKKDGARDEALLFEEAYMRKVGDPGSFVIPISIGESGVLKGVLDLGASVSMMPLTTYEKLGLVGLKPTGKKLMLADQSSLSSSGEIRDVPIVIDGIVVLTDFVVLDIGDKSNDAREWQVLLGRPFMATAQMKIDVCKKKVCMHAFERKLEIDVTTCNDDLKSIGSCFVVEVQSPRTKGGKVCNLVQLYEKSGQDDEVESIGDSEIEELKNSNQELMLEVEVLKAEKYALEKKLDDLAKKNHKLKKVNVALTMENEVTVKELEDLARLTEEFEEESLRKMRKTLMSVDAKNKALDELKEELSMKEMSLKVAKVKECDFLVEIDRMDQAIKELTNSGPLRPKSPMKKGRFPSYPLTCYFCHKKGHVKSRCFEFLKHANSDKNGPIRRSNHVKQIWVRKDLVNPVRDESMGPIWVVKKKLSCNVIDLVDEHHDSISHGMMR